MVEEDLGYCKSDFKCINHTKYVNAKTQLCNNCEEHCMCKNCETKLTYLKKVYCSKCFSLKGCVYCIEEICKRCGQLDKKSNKEY